ncbi:hypothetical protein MHF_1373 [Mycoplasma haemofelis Ohio2]|uniref:Uncharacterized protein n=1 Tax=Mycoplasma haemofelis (strain Ohio2) TaxID=859194 RepID=F6FGH1_MYCHI|nr:hypothetical protein MHF_1373 [Mycoplasma haemofelis Ohio2]
MKLEFIGLSGVAAAGTGLTGYYLYSKSPQDDSIRSKLSSFRLISSLSKEEVEKQWKAEFEIDKDEIKKVITHITDENKGGEALSKWCGENLDKPAKEPLLTNVKRWCTIGSIESRISKDKTFIGEAEQDWESKWSQHSTTEKRKKIGLTQTKGDGTKENDVAAIKAWCNQNRSKDFLAKEKEAVYDEVVSWCVK